MSEGFLEKVYQAKGVEETRDIYDAWAKTYDQEVGGYGYITPQRLAAALGTYFSERKDIAILDYGCGTGVSGVALKSNGFDLIDGMDISQEMLALAREKKIYRQLSCAEAGAPLDHVQGQYHAIAAIGVVSVGAAPPQTLDLLLAALQPGGILVFSYNDHTLEDEDYMQKQQGLIDSGAVRLVLKEHGPHLPKIGIGSTIFLFEKS